MSKILIKNADILTMQANTTVVGDIAIDGDMILAVGTVPENWVPEQTIDGTNKIAMPGLVNAHTHSAMTMFRSYADDMQLMDWLTHKIWPAEDKLTSEDVYWGTMLAILEMVESGTTTFADMYFFMEDTARAVAESGIRAVLARGMAGVAPTAQTALAEAKDLYLNWHGKADGRISVMLGPHAPYTCPPDYLHKVVALANELQAEIHIHLSETTGEVERCIQQYGKSPIQLMDQLGLLNCGVLAAHCVHLSEQDIDIIASKKVRIAHNPSSNMKLASGIAPVDKLLAAGVTVGLGTDGAASNNNLDMFEELHIASLLQKVKGDPTVVPAFEALKMATCYGAQCLALDSTIGTLEAGKKADIILIDCHASHLTPKHDVISLMTYAAGARDVDTVIVNGKILMRDKEVIALDRERILYEASQRAYRLVN